MDNDYYDNNPWKFKNTSKPIDTAYILLDSSSYFSI